MRKPENALASENFYCCDCGRKLTYNLEGKRVYTVEWFTCSLCGKPVCMKCAQQHIALCMALVLGHATIDEETGELISPEKSDQYAMG